MKVLLMLSCFFAFGCAHGPAAQDGDADRSTAASPSAHQTVFAHTHEHGSADCKHATKTVGFDKVYVHKVNGKEELHMPHAGHVDLK